MTPLTTKQFVQLTQDRVCRHIRLAYKLGRKSGLDQAKQLLLAEPVDLIAKWKIAEIIESLKDNTP